MDDWEQNSKRVTEPSTGFCPRQNNNKMSNLGLNNKRIVEPALEICTKAWRLLYFVFFF